MSYNTRRNSGNPQSPQVSYHQTPNTPQRGGGAPQRPGGPNVAYASHFSNPVAYNTQQGYNTAPAKPQDTKPATPAAPTTPAAPAVAPPQPQPPQQQQQKPAAPQPPAEPPAAPAAPAAPAEDVKMEAEATDSATNGATPAPQRPVWMKKGVKVNKVLKKRRQNARLRKILVPKNALMAINEICPGPKFIVQEHTNALNQTIYSVRLEVDGKIHSGQSINKTHAKQMACENALKDILVTRMQSQIQSGPSEFFTQKEGQSMEQDDGASECNDGSSRSGAQAEDDMPWGCLASFALHKLFMEWQNQGVEIPITTAQPIMRKARSNTSINKGVAPANIQPIKKIPEDAHKKHPVLMLNHLQPGLQYSEKVDGSLPNAVFIFYVVIEGQEFMGSGTTKKEAKKECAKAALVKFGIHSEY